MRLLVYGSLRKGAYNFERFQEIFGEKEMSYIETRQIEGYSLHDLGAYPCAVETNDNTPLVVDILEVSDEAHERIKMMELGAGYYEKEIELDAIPHYMYLFEKPYGEQVQEGDWIKYITNLRRK